MFKRIFQHIEVAHVGLLFGFVTLGTALHKEYGTPFTLMMVVVGLVLALAAAHNAYIRNSTALVDSYDERFFLKMSRERKSAALFLLGENANSDELEDVLDFFESPIGSKISTGCIDAEQIASRIVFSIPPFFPVDYNVRACYGAWTVIDGNQS